MENNNLPTFLKQYEIEASVWNTLKNTIYPNAKDESIRLILDYCKAAKLDPLMKFLDIVQVYVKDPVTGKYNLQDAIWPRVGFYRVQASRSGCYAGISEPEFGKDISCDLGGVKITYPEWCKITVKKIVNNSVGEFSAKEYWLENYATSSKSTEAPNAMWAKRRYGQLAKCAEAQALRKAFPELITQQPTAEEMEGKNFK